MDDQALVPAFLLNPAGKICSWNDACQQLFGYPVQAVLHRPLLQLLSPASVEAGEAALRSPLRDHRELDVSVLHADGREIATRLTLVPQFGRSGRLSNYIALVSANGQLARREAATDIGNIPLKSLMNVIAGPFFISEPNGRFVLWNEAMATAVRMSAEQLGAAHISHLLSPKDGQRLQRSVEPVLQGGERICTEVDLCAADGSSVPHLFSATRLKYGSHHYLCATGVDISDRRREQRQLLVRDRALHAVGNGIVICRCAGKDNPIEYLNPAFERITGYTLLEALGRDARFMAAPGLDDAERHVLRLAIEAQHEAHVVFRNLRKDGELFWNDLSITPVRDEDGTVTHFIGLVNDVTALKQRTAHLEHEVNHDPLTGLANRNLLWDRLDQALHAAQRNKSLVATIMLDLNKFKNINDTLGHDIGDEVLKAVARRLQTTVRDTDTVARLSGDEFVLVLADQPSLRFALRMIDRVRHGLARPVAVDNVEVPVAGAIGVSIYPRDGSNACELMRAADAAMYHSKEAGKGDVHFFSAEMKSSTDAKRALEGAMREALENNELFLLYQPRMNLSTSRIAGLEALLRWRHPEQGVLLPPAFLPDAEENGLIVPFGEWVLDQACRMLLRLKALGRVDLPLSVNCSYREFSQSNYISRLAAKLDEFQLAPSAIELDMREEHLLRNPHLSKHVIDRLRALGVTMTIDDFGAGMSNLRYLQELPMRHLKITRGSVSSICPVSNTGMLAKTLINIGHNLQLAVIAAGVENLHQQDFLRQEGCDEIQGNFYQQPVSEAELRNLLSMA